MSTELHIVDAFADGPFQGNPAGVCILEDEAEATWMQKLAREIGPSETAFLFPGAPAWNLRWFTPAVEVDLCGHATLASAYTLWRTGRAAPGDKIAFVTRSGILAARQEGDWITLDFPAEPADPAPCPDGLAAALGTEPIFVGRNRFDLLAELSSEAAVRGLKPDLAALGRLPARGIIVTAASGRPGYDFVSRFFAPAIGIPEDPVTGSAHCCLGPYWEKKLGRSVLTGFQCSPRGGTVRVSTGGERVRLSGKAVPILSGRLLV